VAPKSNSSTSAGELVTAVRSGTLDLGIDSTALVQEFLPVDEGAIVRIEVLNGEFLYAIKVFPPPEKDSISVPQISARKNKSR